MAALLVIVVGLITTTLGGIMAALNIREKLWPKPPSPHPLEAVVRDIAAAIREGRPA